MDDRETDLLVFILDFVSDFEGDYVMNGEIVDNPPNIMIENYKKAKEFLKKWNL